MHGQRRKLCTQGCAARDLALTQHQGLAAAQAAFAATRRLLKERLKLDSQEFESLVTLLRSQLDLSISRVLGPARSDPSDR